MKRRKIISVVTSIMLTSLLASNAMLPFSALAEEIEATTTLTGEVTEGFLISVADTEVYAGNTIDIPVAIQSSSISALKCKFDMPTGMELIGIKSSVNAIATNLATGTILYAPTESAPKALDAVVTLKVKVTSGAKTGKIGVSNVDASEEYLAITPQIKTGTVTVKESGFTAYIDDVVCDLTESLVEVPVRLDTAKEGIASFIANLSVDNGAQIMSVSSKSVELNPTTGKILWAPLTLGNKTFSKADVFTTVTVKLPEGFKSGDVFNLKLSDLDAANNDLDTVLLAKDPVMGKIIVSDTTTTTISVADTEVYAGNTIDVPVAIQSSSISALKCKFDMPAGMELIGIKSSVNAIAANLATGTILYAPTESAPKALDAVVTLKVKVTSGAKTGKIGVSNVDASEEYLAITPQIKTGTVTVKESGFTAYIDDVVCDLTESLVEVPIRLDTAKEGIASFIANLSVDNGAQIMSVSPKAVELNPATGKILWAPLTLGNKTFSKADVFATVTVKLPEGYKSGDVFNLKLSDLDAANNDLDTVLLAKDPVMGKIIVSDTTTTTSTPATEGLEFNVNAVVANFSSEAQVVEVPVMVAGNPGFAAAKFDFTFSAGMSIAKEADVKEGLLKGLTVGNSSVLWIAGNGSDITANGELFALKVTVPANTPVGVYPIGLTIGSDDLANEEYKSVVAEKVEAGSIEIIDGTTTTTTVSDTPVTTTTTVSDTTASETTITTVSDTTVTTTGTGITSEETTVTTTGTGITSEETTVITTGTGITSEETTVTTTGTGITSEETTVTTTGTGITSEETTVTTTTGTGVTSEETTVTTTEPTSKEFSIDIAKVTVNYSTLDQVVKVPVSIKNNPGFASFKFNFETSKLEIKSIIEDGMISGISASRNNTSLRWVVEDPNGNNDVKQDGVLFTLEVLVPAGTAPGTYPITFDNFGPEDIVDKDDTILTPKQLIDGEIEIIALTPTETTITTVSDTTPSETTITTVSDTTPSETTITTVSDTTPSETTITTVSDTTPSETTVTTVSDTTPSETTVSDTTPSETTVSDTTPSETTVTTVSDTTPSETTVTTVSDTTPSETTVTTVSDTTPSETTVTTVSDTTPTETTPVTSYGSDIAIVTAKEDIFVYAEDDNFDLSDMGVTVNATGILFVNGVQTRTETRDVTPYCSIKEIPSQVYDKSKFMYTVNIVATIPDTLEGNLVAEYLNMKVGEEVLVGTLDVIIGQRGDANLDHDVSTLDAVSKLNYINALNLGQTYNMSVDEDVLGDQVKTSAFAAFLANVDESGGGVATVDVVKLLNYINALNLATDPTTVKWADFK